MFGKLMTATLITAAAMAASPVPSNAAVTRVDNGNTWFVGKGDVQSLFGWDAKTTDANFDSVTFTYEKTTEHEIECEFTFSEGERNEKVRIKVSTEELETTTMSRELQYSTKRNSQDTVTGATISPGGSNTSVSNGGCPDSPDNDALTESEVSNAATMLGRPKRTVVSTTITETIYASSGVVRTAKKGSTATLSTVTITNVLWSDTAKFTGGSIDES